MVAVDAADDSQSVEAHIVFSENISRNFALLDLAADQCKNVHRCRGAVKIDILEHDQGLEPYAKRISEALQKQRHNKEKSSKWNQLTKGVDYLTMYEEFPGKSLVENFELIKKLSNNQRYSMFAQMNSAVHALHNIHIPKEMDGYDKDVLTLVHHDISVKNFLIREPQGERDDSFIVLSDFETATPKGETPMLKQVTNGNMLFLNIWYAPFSFFSPDQQAAPWEDLHELSYTIGDIFLILERGDDTFHVPRRTPSFELGINRAESDADYYREISRFSPDLAYALRMANYRINDDLSVKEWWNNYIEPALRGYYKIPKDQRISLS